MLSYDFPIEILERILIFADGNTLLNAKKVSKRWESVVDYLTKKTLIWKACCLREMSPDKLTALRNAYHGGDSNEKWFHIYTKSFPKNIDMCNMEMENFRPENLNYFSCGVFMKNQIFFGHNNGVVSFYDEKDKFCLSTHRVRPAKLSELIYINGKTNYLIASTCKKLFVYKVLEGDLKIISLLQDVLKYSIYKTYVCCELPMGHVQVFQIDGTLGLRSIKYCRIYGPQKIYSICNWKGNVSIATTSKIYSFSYTDSESEIANLKLVGHYCFSSYGEICSFFYNKYLFRTTNFRLTLLCLENDQSRQVMKEFDCLEYLKSRVSCIYLHGEMLLIGTESGSVFIYYVQNWDNFDIKDCQKDLYLSVDPIIGFDVQEVDAGTKILIITKSYATILYFNTNTN